MEQGGGAKLFQGFALVLGIVVFSVFLSHKRFTGTPDEYMAEQAVYAKNIADGKGFTTSVVWPQTVALLEQRDEDFVFRSGDDLPELYNAPLYPLVLAGAFKVSTAVAPEWTWKDPLSDNPAEHPAFNADFIVLAVNIALFWLSLLFTFLLARLLFSMRTALLAVGAMTISVGLWDEVLKLTGVALLYALVPLVFLLWAMLEKHLCNAEEEKRKGGPHWLAAVGVPVVLGLCFLAEYSTIVLVPLFIVYLAIRCKGPAMGVHIALLLLVFAGVTGWWFARNVNVSGNALGLAWQEIVLKEGDPTAEPNSFKRALSVEAPAVSIPKIGNKVFTQLEENIRTHIWSSGGYVFMAFFIAGMMYTFRNQAANNLRWVLVITYAVLLLSQPILDSGASPRLPAYYLCPLLIIFGAGFFSILLESTATGQQLKQWGIIALLMGVQAAPMLHSVAAPSIGVRFTYPPYFPRFMTYTRTLLSERFIGDYGMMADIPAGLAWYSQQKVWAQPTEYEDFIEITLRQNIGALYLSPEILSKPYFSQLVRYDLDAGEDFRTQKYWGAVYGSLQSGDLPDFFPLQVIHQLYSDMYVLENPLATNRPPKRPARSR